jgi:hypothetical protein
MNRIKILIALILIIGVLSGFTCSGKDEGAQMAIENMDNIQDVLVYYAIAHLKDPSGKTKRPGPGWERLRTLGISIIPAISRVYSKQFPFDIRLSLIHITQQIGDKTASSFLEKIIGEEEPRIVQAAAEALGCIGGTKAFETLISLLESDNEYHCLGAIYGLERLNNPKAIEPLLNVLLKEDTTVSQFNESSSGIPVTLHKAAANAIDKITGQNYNGIVEEIKKWIVAKK